MSRRQPRGAEAYAAASYVRLFSSSIPGEGLGSLYVSTSKRRIYHEEGDALINEGAGELRRMLSAPPGSLWVGAGVGGDAPVAPGLLMRNGFVFGLRGLLSSGF